MPRRAERAGPCQSGPLSLSGPWRGTAVSSQGSLVQNWCGLDSLEQGQGRATGVIKGLEHLLCEERLQELSVLNLENRGLKEILSISVDIQQVGMRKRERLWAVVPRDRTRGSRHRLKHIKFLRTGENAFFTVKVAKEESGNVCS